MECKSDDNKVLVDIEELDRLRDDSDFLNALRNNGVDNWSGYDEACRDRRNRREEKEKSEI